VPHFPKPFFKESRGRWYVQIGPKQYNLGPDEDPAFERYHELMRQQPKEGSADVTLAVGVLDAFLSWVEKNVAARTYEWYQRHCQAFASSLDPLLTVTQLKKHHLTACLSKLKHSSATKNGLCRAVMRAFKWAEDEEHIQKSPLAGFKKPQARRRETVITTEQFEKLLPLIARDHFRDLVTVCWDTGCRAQEIVKVEKRHVDFEIGRWVFPAEESKGKSFPRVVYLTPRALKITKRLCEAYPTGPIFRNDDRVPWTRHAVSCVFLRMKEKLGRKLCLTAIRHSWATLALKRGVDPLTVAILMGHTDPSMLAKVYAHLAQDPEYLLKAAKKATAA
jgi:integrase/recombinase XerC